MSHNVKFPGKEMKVRFVEVVEGPLYDVYGEDSLLVVYNLRINVIGWDYNIYTHHHLFKGAFVDEEDGCNRVDYNAKPEAHRLADRIHKAGKINLKYWEKSGQVVDVERFEERLEEMWSCQEDYAEFS